MSEIVVVCIPRRLLRTTAGHQGWEADIFTVGSDMVLTRAVGSVVGLSGFGGSVCDMLAASAIGFLLEATHSDKLIFAPASVSYFAALGLVYLASLVSTWRFILS